MPNMRVMLSTPINPPIESPMTHEYSNKVMMHDSTILKTHNCDYDLLSKDHHNSDLSHGIEFRQVSILKSLLYKHKNWEQIANFLVSIFDSDFHPISDDQLLLDVRAATARVNHRYAINS